NAGWNTAGNWNLSHAPTADEVAYVDTAAPVSLDVSQLSASVVAGLHVSSRSEIDLTASHGAGSFTVDGALINLGTIRLTDGTTLETSGAIHNSHAITIGTGMTEAPAGA